MIIIAYVNMKHDSYTTKAKRNNSAHQHMHSKAILYIYAIEFMRNVLSFF